MSRIFCVLVVHTSNAYRMHGNLVCVYTCGPKFRSKAEVLMITYPPHVQIPSPSLGVKLNPTAGSPEVSRQPIILNILNI